MQPPDEINSEDAFIYVQRSEPHPDLTAIAIMDNDELKSYVNRTLYEHGVASRKLDRWEWGAHYQGYEVFINDVGRQWHYLITRAITEYIDIGYIPKSNTISSYELAAEAAYSNRIDPFSYG